MGLGKNAAQLHRNMCDDSRFGYSWEERWGGPDTVTWNIGGKNYTVNVGDYDCSSSTITAWRKMLQGTPYAGALDGATYTGNMRSVFVGSGLFEWVGVSDAQPGDLYLNEQYHVAMCQGGGMLSEFSGNEWGGFYGGQRGDQTGWESHVCGYYWYPWDGCLHYNGKLDVTEVDDLKYINNYGGDVYRLKNPNGFHYFTKSASERDSLVAKGWKDEGVAFTTRRGGSDAVYRMYNASNGDHLYTTNYDEAHALQVGGWTYEGVDFFAWPDGTAVYRMYNPHSGEHFMTANKKERDNLTAAGWQYESSASFTV